MSEREGASIALIGFAPVNASLETWTSGEVWVYAAFGSVSLSLAYHPLIAKEHACPVGVNQLIRWAEPVGVGGWRACYRGIWTSQGRPNRRTATSEPEGRVPAPYSGFVSSPARMRWIGWRSGRARLAEEACWLLQPFNQSEGGVARPLERWYLRYFQMESRGLMPWSRLGPCPASSIPLRWGTHPLSPPPSNVAPRHPRDGEWPWTAMERPTSPSRLLHLHVALCERNSTLPCPRRAVRGLSHASTGVDQDEGATTYGGSSAPGNSCPRQFRGPQPWPQIQACRGRQGEAQDNAFRQVDLVPRPLLCCSPVPAGAEPIQAAAGHGESPASLLPPPGVPRQGNRSCIGEHVPTQWTGPASSGTSQAVESWPRRSTGHVVAAEAW